MEFSEPGNYTGMASRPRPVSGCSSSDSRNSFLIDKNPSGFHYISGGREDQIVHQGIRPFAVVLRANGDLPGGEAQQGHGSILTRTRSAL